MAKKVAVLLDNEFEDIEFTSPKEAIENAGHEVVVIGKNANEEVTGKHGEKVTVDVGIADAKAEDYDALLLPGGFAPDLLRGDSEGRFGAFAKYYTTNDVPVFAICHGPQILIDTDDLEGRTMTAVLNIRKDLSNAGAHVVDESVVVDKNIVTSRTPDDLDDFNHEIAKQLEA
ncbi:type 1 glutamine amidotransferase domain-containing protein [Staphylococcus massiliensis]|uniref:General stress protein GSP18 n=1 Tax=Staphylococcus massiliensis S46 TaxID=1229783 RepID=K9AZ89_9STAP|nr:type 1 glutamine amidotransferase domain-containing protein [Staphylococcus massiliensis]EKU46825.1 general stress protein GSP18 [Staphylococcus massiliensis S46]MCG3399960.1 type 1 glutamine amidotransferase [Staphylococcus massiliensis]MCG3402679.1 type 1 glutamine amidotransferase [Staphylococcus massiliensis]MCG3412926.1 type 1 glutamine amidotransferase [Staphylococcus massiliensis]POA01565.1 type 1 glutamine amidotransferase [Staphylococcus massiliensis CCUG 55927]